ncbi:hypothetical protein ACAF76_004750 [Brevibacillus sp. TJ4]|uniref:hypothetical protein n=1 Tax=Brevibacillus sp. TJ4 TaxID=3234853 RepID=UPI0037CF7276
MSIFPFIIAVIVLIFVALLGTVIIGLRGKEEKQRTFTQRSRNLLAIYITITLILLIALVIYLYRL